MAGEHKAFMALALIMAVKLVISRLHNWRLD
jgi:hypothetical protein